MIGSTLSHYSVTSKLGEGGMGIVYAATDVRLGRPVAIKVLPPDALADADRRARFVREARAASALNHSSIVTIHEIDSAAGVDFIVMELVAGRPLDRVIPPGGMPIDRAVDCAAQIACALKAAHAAGIVHRDIKPANVMVADDGRVKVLDFGLAKLARREAAPDESTVMATAATAAGVLLGTVAYMAPEQAKGQPADARSDVFSLGAVMYEMLTGRRLIEGDSALTALASLLHGKHPPVESLRADVPPDLARLVGRATSPDPAARPTAADVEQALASWRTRAASVDRLSTALRRPAVLVPAACVLALAVAAGWWTWRSASRARWARNTAVPEIQRLVDRQDYDAAFRLAQEALDVLPDDPLLRQLWIDMTFESTISSEPADTIVQIKGFSTPDVPWHALGRAPMKGVRVPFGLMRMRVSKDGYETVEGAQWGPRIAVKLDPAGSVPAGMVRVLSGTIQVGNAAVTVPDFWIGKYEVTNRQFKGFVDAGGYRRRELWQIPFVDGGRPVPWEAALARFRDTTGRPGPAGWELGAYPDGQDDLPVTGVSWYEAAAYAAFEGKALPTIFEWRRAADQRIFSDVLTLSNFSGKGPAPVGTYRGLGTFGTYDMAGNVKEWCWNEARDLRYILGGAWNEPPYSYEDTDAQSPFSREPTYGFRTVKYMAPPPAAAFEPVVRIHRDFAKERPVSDEVFEVYRSLYRYDRRPLNATVEAVAEQPSRRKETVSFDAAYGAERVRAYLYLPPQGRPPYQTVVFFPGTDARILTSSRELRLQFVDFLIRSGRAVLFPVYKGTYERGPSIGAPLHEYRDLMIAWSKDLGRALDYLETRPDVDRTRLGYFGLSLGASAGVVFTALEPRFRASVLLAGGLSSIDLPGEIDGFNFAPRVRVPTLMVNGRDDFEEPLEAIQKPLFQALGTAPADKRHAVLDGGHLPRLQDTVREVLDWLDRHLGPVDSK